MGLTSVIFHDQASVSLGLRKLATMKQYRRFLNFYQMKNPPPQRLRELGIDRLSKLVTFLPDPMHLVEPDSSEPIDKVYYDEAFIFDKLRRYLDAMISDHARYLQTPPEVRSERGLARSCLERRADLCLFFVLDKQREERNEQLVGWRQAPGARTSHPREEHLIPMMVAAGASEGAGEVIYSDNVLGAAISAIRFS